MKKAAQLLLRAMPAPAGEAAVTMLGSIGRRVGRRGVLPVHPGVEAKSFGVEGSHCFFGYYDLTPFDRAGGRLLAGRRPVSLGRRAAGTMLEIGYFDLTATDGKFVPFGGTTTWCWQQGARLQWLNALGLDAVIYNQTVMGVHGSVIQDAVIGTVVSKIPAPVYSVHPKARVAISLNFARLQRLRAGYGYGDLPDSTRIEGAPTKDGLWLVDLNTGNASYYSPLPKPPRSILTSPCGGRNTTLIT